MNKTITHDDLLLYAYNELDQDSSELVELAIACDPVIADQYKEIIEMQLELDEAMLKPDPTSLLIIMEESSSAMEVH